MENNITLDDIAARIMFGKIKTQEELVRYMEDQWEFKEGKEMKDVHRAIRHSKMNGMEKSEMELSSLELYLKNVLKKVVK